MIMCAQASTVAAPPMSFFMISMALSGLRSSPPVSKQTPLPTSVTLGSVALPQRSSISRGARVLSAARPTAWISGKFCFSRSSPTIERTFAPCCFGKRTRGGFELGRAHVVGRRVDEIARERHAFGDAREVVAIDAVGQHEPHVLVLRLAVAREAVRAEREGQRRRAARRAARWRSDRRPPAARRAAGPAGRRSCRPFQPPGRTARRRCRCCPAGSNAARAAARSPTAFTKARARLSSLAMIFGKLAGVTNQIGCAALLRATKMGCMFERMSWPRRSNKRAAPGRARWLKSDHCPQFGIMPIGVEVQHGPKLPPL